MADFDYNKLFLIFLVAFIVAFLFLMSRMVLDPDNGTHALLSLFYKDTVESVIRSGDFSFQNVYSYGISYLVHYPKLQVFYQPLYHLTTGMIFYNAFGVSAWTAGFCNLVFAVLSICAMYMIVMKMYGPKAALIAAVLFSLFPYMLTLTGRPMVEYTTMFFLLLSLLIYLEIKDGNGKWGYVLLALSVVLATLSKYIGAFVFLVYFIHLLSRRKWKQAIVLLIASLIMIAPYAALILKINGTQTVSTIWGRYAFEGIDVSLSFFIEFPFLFVFIGAFAYYMYRGKHRDKLLLALWFVTFLAAMLATSIKPRYFVYFLIPTFIVFADYLSRRRKALVAVFVLVYALFSVATLLPILVQYPQESTARSIYDSSPVGSGVAMLSEGDNFYSSSLMFYLDKFDSESGARKDLFVYRPCAFFNKTSVEILDLFKENNVLYVVAVPGEDGYENLAAVSGGLTQVSGGYAEVYKVNDFTMKDRTEYCNYVCLIDNSVCTAYKTPYDALSG